MIRSRIAAALCAVFLMLPLFTDMVYAAEVDIPTEDVTVIAADIVTGSAPEDEGPDIPAEPSVSAVEEKELVAPPGTGTVVEHGINGDGKEFYTIMTAEEYVFYLIIDNQRVGQNVYFLNAVTIADLMALAEQGGAAVNSNGGSVSAIPDPNKNNQKPAEQEPEPSAEPEPGTTAESGNNMGMLVLFVLVLLGGGGAAYYFKVYRPKQQKAETEADDYDYSEDEADPYGGDDETEPEDDGGGQAWYAEDESGGGDGGGGDGEE